MISLCLSCSSKEIMKHILVYEQKRKEENALPLRIKFYDILEKELYDVQDS